MQDALFLENEIVRLSPLLESHWESLWPVAQQVDLYQFGPNDVSTIDKLKNYIGTALKDTENGTAIPFISFDKRNATFIGCTRFGQIDHNNKTLHIGWTWISPEAQGTGINHQMKFLMLTHAFETMRFEKVEFRIDERNLKSRKAVEKLGATLEGILRKNVITKNNFRRSSCCYGILKEEWENIKATRFNQL